MGQTPMPPSAMRRRSIQTFGPPPPPPPMPPMPQMGPHLPPGIGMAASGLGRRHSLYEPGPMSGEMMEHPMMRRMSIGGGMVPPPPPVPMGLNRPFGNSNMDLPLGNGDHSGTNSNNNSAPSTPWMPASYFSSPSGGGGGPPLSMNPQHQHQNPMTSMMTSSVSMGGMLPPPMGMPPPGMMMPPPSMGMGPAPPGMGFPGMGMMPPPPMGMMPPGMMNGMNNNGNGSANASMMGDDHHHDDMPNHQDQNDMRSGNGGNQGGGIMDGPPMSGGSGGGGSNGRGMDPSIGGMNGGMNGNNMGGGDMMNHHDDDMDQRHHGGGFGSGRGDDEMMHHGGGGPRGGGNFGNGGPGGPSSGMMMQGGGGGFGSPMMNGMPGGGRFGNGRQPQLGRSKSFFGSIFGNNGGSGNKNMMMDMNRWDRDSMVPLEDALQQMSIHKQGGGGGPAGMPGGGGLSRKSSRKLSTKAQQLQQFPGLWCYRPKNIMFQQQQQQHGEDEHGGGSNIWAPFSVANQHKLHRASEMNGGTTISLDKEEKLPGTVYVSPRTMLARHFRSTFGNPDILEIQYLPTQDTTFVVRPEFHPNEMGGYGGGSRRNPGPGSGGVTRLFSNVFGGGSQ
ncbi:hypothetical protein BDC45DRAFT_507449 [Circinella umbellata]|nr:hypothetical protein BDC45DRAFT_507449 [Circinella umbellata]